MARKCEMTGKGPVTGNRVSHSNIKTRTRWLPNIQRKKYLIPEMQQTLTLSLCTDAIKTIDKLGGVTPALFKMKEANLSERLLHIRNQIRKQRAAGTKSAAK